MVHFEAWRAHAKHRDASLLSPSVGPQVKLAALVEEVGEVGRALTYDQSDASLNEELLQVASVALSWLQSRLDQQEANTSGYPLRPREFAADTPARNPLHFEEKGRRP